MRADKWAVKLPLWWAPPPDAVCHARLTESDNLTLCERDGPEVDSSKEFSLILDEATEEHLPFVNCPSCIAWMRA